MFWKFTWELLRNFETVKQKLEGKILKLKKKRDKCPQEKKKMRHPLAFHAEGKKYFWLLPAA